MSKRAIRMSLLVCTAFVASWLWLGLPTENDDLTEPKTAALEDFEHEQIDKVELTSAG